MQVSEKFSTALSVEGVWKVVADLDHWKDWTPTILDISPLSDTGLEVGG